MNEQDRLIRDTTSRLLADLCTPGVVDAAEAGKWPGELWDKLTETGLTLAGIPESAGGSGGEIEDSLLIIREAALFAAPVPLAEQFIAALLLGEQGAVAGTDPITIASGDFELTDDGVLTGSAEWVAFARWSNEILLVARTGAGNALCRVPTSELSITPSSNMAGEPRDSISAELVTSPLSSRMVSAPPI